MKIKYGILAALAAVAMTLSGAAFAQATFTSTGSLLDGPFKDGPREYIAEAWEGGDQTPYVAPVVPNPPVVSPVIDVPVEPVNPIEPTEPTEPVCTTIPGNPIYGDGDPITERRRTYTTVKIGGHTVRIPTGWETVTVGYEQVIVGYGEDTESCESGLY